MDVLAKVNPDEILEVYKDMGMPKISESNMEFLLDMMKKLELDKKLREEGREEDAINFLKLGIDEEMIAKGTGLSIERILELKEKYQIES